MKLKKFVKSLVALALTLLAVSVAVDFLRKPAVPDNALTTVLYDIQNRPVLLAQLDREQPAVLYFWGSWCGFCNYLSPAVNRLAEDGTPVITVALRSGDNRQVQHYLNRKGYTFTTINDPRGEIAAQWEVGVTPTVIIFKQGRMELAATGLTSYWGLKVRLFLAQFF